jgi:hypothetical protein
VVQAQTGNLLFGVGHPVWPNDRYGSPVDIQGLVNLVKSSGGNTWREAMYADSSVDSYYTNLKGYCDQAGVNFVIQTLSASVGAVTYQEESNIILNVGSAQSNWINAWSAKIQALHPYGIMVMNEPTNGGTHQTASYQRFTAYRQFCNAAISAWRQIQPDLVIFVNNDPFNDFYDSTTYGFAAFPLEFSGVLYGRHIYYAYDGQYPPSYLPDQQAYWNGNTAQGKVLLAQLIESESSALRMKGQTVIWDEWGAAVAAPHSDDYVRDFVSICNSKNIGSIYYDIVPTSYEQSGILNEDYRSLNSVGLAWAGAAPSLPTPSPYPTATPIPSNPGGGGGGVLSPSPSVSPSALPNSSESSSRSPNNLPYVVLAVLAVVMYSNRKKKRARRRSKK